MSQINQSDRIVELAVDKLGEVLFETEALPKDWATVVFGESARLDSMGFVNFVTALEETIETETSMVFNLAEEIDQAIAGGRQLKTLKDLSEFITHLLARKGS